MSYPIDEQWQAEIDRSFEAWCLEEVDRHLDELEAKEGGDGHEQQMP